MSHNDIMKTFLTKTYDMCLDSWYIFPKLMLQAIKEEVILGFEVMNLPTPRRINQYLFGINSPRDEYTNRRPQSAVDKLKNMFVELGMIKKEDNFDIKYLGAGEYKKAYKG